MKSSNANLLSFVLYVIVLLLGACSFHRVIPTLPDATVSMNIPTQPATIESKPLNTLASTPTLLFFSGKIAFLVGNGNWVRLYVMYANGAGLTDITPPNLLRINNLSWSPDAQYIAFDAITDPQNPIVQVYIIKADGSDLRQITFGQQDSDHPCWSPDGKNIIFTHYTDRGDELDIMNPDGTEIRKLVDGVSDYSYRNDGSISVSIPATRDLTTTFIINSEGLVQDRLPNFPNRIVPQWSPDRKSIVAVDLYRTDCCTACTDIVVMESIGYNETCIKIEGIIPPTVAVAATWSPDGKYILFTANPSGKWKIYLVKPDGTDLIQLVNLEDARAAVWSASP